MILYFCCSLEEEAGRGNEGFLFCICSIKMEDADFFMGEKLDSSGSLVRISCNGGVFFISSLITEVEAKDGVVKLGGE